MAFSFNQRKDIADQVRALASEEMTAAIDLAESHGDFNQTVHKLRRRCKKIRGLLRLVKPNFSAFHEENRAFRDAANALSAPRDAAVMVETFDSAMRSAWAGDLSYDRKQQLRQILVANLHQISVEQDRDELLGDFAKTVKHARQRVENWSLRGDGFSLIAPGLRDTYAAMRKRMAKAAKTGEAVDFHEWRKEAKAHVFHVGLLKNSAPAVLERRKAQLKVLGTLLGDHHNLAVLAETLERMNGTLDPALAEGLKIEQRALAEKALSLGRQLSVENPGVLTARFGKFWKLLPKER